MLALAAAAICATWLASRPTSHPRTEPPPTPAGEVRHDAPPQPALGRHGAPLALPPLDETDPLVRELVRALSHEPAIENWLVNDGLLRNFTVIALALGIRQSTLDANVADERPRDLESH